MAMREVDAISDAIDATQKEIAAFAWDKEDEVVLDETGDRRREAIGEGLEGQQEVEEEEPESEEGEGEESETEGEEGETKDAKTEGEDKPKVEADKVEPEGKVPPGVHREAQQRARAAEAERDALKGKVEEGERTFKSLADKLDLALRQIDDLRRAPAQTSPKPEDAKQGTKASIPDLIEDPQGFVQHLTGEFRKELSSVQQGFARQRFEDSLASAHERHGDTFVKAYAAMEKLDPQNPAQFQLGQSIVNTRNPGEEMVKWFKRNETLREVGDDPGKFKERIATETREALMKDPEFRKQLIADLRKDASTGDDGKPRTATRLPKSLNGTPGGTSAHTDSMFDGSEQAIADSAWR